jgi:hypothetical protein
MTALFEPDAMVDMKHLTMRYSQGSVGSPLSAMTQYGPPEKVYVENEWYDGPRAGIGDSTESVIATCRSSTKRKTSTLTHS